MGPSGVTPVTIVCGLPGAGRAGLVERLVADARFADTAVVQSEGRLFGPAAGCFCCRIANELVARLRELHFARATGAIARFRRVIVEATGSADPASILATLADLPLVAARYAPGGIVTVVGSESDGVRDPEALRRVAIADRVVVAGAPPPDAATLLDIDVYAAPPVPAAVGVGSGGIRSFTWNGASAASAEAFGAALEALAATHGDRILKLAGRVEVAGSDRLMGVLGVGHTLFPPAWREPRDGGSTRVVFTVRDLEEGTVAQMLNPSASAPSQNSGLRNPRADHGRHR